MIRSAYEVNLRSSAASTAATEQYSSEVDVSNWDEGLVCFHTNAASGTSVTMTLKLYTKSVEDSRWFLHSTLVSALDINAATTTAVATAYGITNIGKRIRVGSTLAGTNANATYDMQLILKA